MRKRVRRERHKQPRNIFFVLGFSVLVVVGLTPILKGTTQQHAGEERRGGAEPRPYSLSPAPGHGCIAVSV